MLKDRKNFPKTHIVFKASNFKRNGWDPRVVVYFQDNVWVDTPTHLYSLAESSNFQTADDWYDQEERNGWDPRVVVYFQDNVWVDTPTHLYSLAESSNFQTADD